MLPPPDSIFEAYRLGLLFCLAFGGTCSIPAVWNYLFKKSKDGEDTYLKAGEYGETELNSTWSVFKEPLNAWTSLAYSLFGVVISFVGYMDCFADPDLAENNITLEPAFSLLIGAACIYLGISSFLFHASHTETWRKADAGMTSGICIPLVVFAIWDRTRLHGVNSLFMVAVGVFVIFSLTHGFVPYGSSDVLLPLSIVIVWSFELVPRYGGPMHDEEYLYWARCLFAVLGGAVLRAVDIKRSVVNTKMILLVVYFTLVTAFGFLIGFTDDCTICAIVAGFVVALYPARGHVCWHVASAYALYIWWYLLRTRPGNPETSYHNDSIFMNFVLFVVVKNGFRRLIMSVPANWLAPAYQDRARLLVEHALFAVWGFVTIVELPGVFHSWLLHPILCWYKPVFPNRAFLVYYTAKVATHVEDAIYLWVTGATYTQQIISGPLALPGALLPFHIGQIVASKANSTAAGDNPGSSNSSVSSKGGNDRKVVSAQDTKDSDRDEVDPMRGKSMISAMSNRSERAKGERMRSLHHNIAALMAVVSLFASYAKVGSLVALSHDVCEVVLDLFKIAALRGWRQAQIVLLVTTILLYAYWRVWYFTTSVLYTVAVESKHMIDHVNCEPGACTWMQVPERLPFLACLLILLGMNCVSIYRMCKVGYRIVNPTGVN